MTRTIARLPAAARAPVAIDGDQLVYVTGGGCNDLHLLTLPDGPDRRLGRGTCGSVRQVDIEGDSVGAAVSTEPPDGEDSFPSEAWLADRGSPGVRVVQEEDAGYSGPDQITGVMLDDNALFTVRLNEQGPNTLLRIPVDGGSPSLTRIFGEPLFVAKDRNTTFVVDAVDLDIRASLMEYPPGRP